jgi:hypothetical protein
MLRGETGGQSPVPRAVGAFLGLKHTSEDMFELGLHMHPEHRAFVQHLASGPCVKDYASKREELKPAFNGTLAALTRFREAHILLAKTYLAKHAIGSGTGKSHYASYLAHNLAETKHAMKE